MPNSTPRDFLGAIYFGGACVTTGCGIAVTSVHSVPCWIVGQLIIATCVIQWFVLLHECGHRTCFRSRRLNHIGGHIAGFCTGIPLVGWKRIHNMHHKWTGWQDIDPTTAPLAPKPRGRIVRGMANIAWRFWIPLFSLLYRYENFWNWQRMRRLFPGVRVRRGMALNLVVCGIGYLACAALVGPVRLVIMLGPGVWLGLALLDPVMLSQHTHIPQLLSLGARVKPHAPAQQVPFTRSLMFPTAISRGLLMGFDAHELHHRHPHVAGYHLHRLSGDTPNAVNAWRWIRAAKRVPAEVFLFQNRNQTGLTI